MRKANIGNLSLHYLTQGKGSDVVLIHGVTSSMAVWVMHLMPRLVSDFRVTAFDLRGHGLSDAPATGYTSLDNAKDLLALLDVLQIERTHLIGHSFGGSVALQFALAHPERTASVLVADTGLACLRTMRDIDNWHGWTTWKDDLEKYGMDRAWFDAVDEGDAREMFEKGLEVPTLFAQSGRMSRRGKDRLRRLIAQTTIADDFRKVAGLTEQSLTEITVPILAVYGATSMFRNIAPHLEKVMLCCLHRILEGTGHFSVMDSLDEFVSCAIPFMNNPSEFVLAGRTAKNKSQVRIDQ